MHDFARDLRDRGPAAEADFNEHFKGQPLGNLHTFAGSDQVRQWEEEYLPAAEPQVRRLRGPPALEVLTGP